MTSFLEKTAQRAQVWIEDMKAELGTGDAQKALQALRAGLQALRDRLTVEEAAQLSAQLPVVIRGLFFEGWNPTGKPLRIRHRAEFLELVREKYLPRDDAAPDDVARAVFRVLERHVSTGEMTDIILSLPEEFVSLAAGQVGRQ